MYVVKGAETKFVRKIRTISVDEIDYYSEKEPKKFLKESKLFGCLTQNLLTLEYFI